MSMTINKNKLGWVHAWPLLAVIVITTMGMSLLGYTYLKAINKHTESLAAISLILKNIDDLDAHHTAFKNSLGINTTHARIEAIENGKLFYEQSKKTLSHIQQKNHELTQERNILSKLQDEYASQLSMASEAEHPPQEIIDEMNNATTAIYAQFKSIRNTLYEKTKQDTESLNIHNSTLKLIFYALIMINLLLMFIQYLAKKTTHKKYEAIHNKNQQDNPESNTEPYLDHHKMILEAIMQNVKQGIFTFSADLTIDNHYSAYLETLCGDVNLSGRNLFDVIFNKSDVGVDQRDQLLNTLKFSFSESLDQFTWNEYLLPKEAAIKTKNHSGPRHLTFDWIALTNPNGLINKFMVIVRDISEIKKLNTEALHQKRELHMLGEIIEATPSQFKAFIDSTRNYLIKNAQLIEESRNNKQIIDSLFINMHTIKGNARTQGFSYITNAAHHAEQYYDELRKNKNQEWDINRLRFDLQKVEDTIDEYDKNFRDKLTKMTEENTTVNFFQQVKESIKSALDVESDYQRQYIDYLNYFVSATEAVSIKAMIRPLQKSCALIAQEMNKNIPIWVIEGENLLLRADIASGIKDALMHCMRNCIDYGIETSEIRRELRKDPAGKITIEAKEEKGRFYLAFYDDGEGLDLVALEQIANKQGMLTSENISDEKIAKMIFFGGVTTKQGMATDISGRGVGMGAASSLIEQIGGLMRIEFMAPRKDNRRKFKIVIEIHADNCLVEPINLSEYGEMLSKAS